MEWMCGHIHFLQNVEKMFNKGIALNQFEVYQTMLDKGFNVKLSHQSLQ